MLKEYLVTKPKTAEELEAAQVEAVNEQRMTRGKALGNYVIQLTVVQINDELAARRGMAEEMIDFTVGSTYRGETPFINGFIDGDEHTTARIDILEDELHLTVHYPIDSSEPSAA